MNQYDNQYGTPFQESEAILAAQQHDLPTVEQILASMTVTEVRSLRAAADMLEDACRKELQRRDITPRVR